jgi:Na+-transporting methylmalonyl-CoA/oxaloacetate decarboxylase gamma subunit
MKYITALIMFIFIMSPLMTEAVHAAKPADKEQALPVTVDVTPPVPTTIPLPTTVQNPPPSPIPTKAPVVTPIAEPTTIPVVTPTAAPTPIPSPAPVEVSKKEKEKDIMVSIGEVISHLGDAPTPTPTPQAVQVAQASIARAVPAEKKVVTASPAKKIQQFIEPSATFFLHTIPGNYYLVNSLSKTQSASLLLLGVYSCIIHKDRKLPEHLRHLSQPICFRSGHEIKMLFLLSLTVITPNNTDYEKNTCLYTHYRWPYFGSFCGV